MSKEEIFQVILSNIFDVLYELEGTDIKITDSLKSLGANSIDRVDIIMASMESLGVKCDMIEFKDAKNIDEIASILQSKLG